MDTITTLLRRRPVVAAALGSLAAAVAWQFFAATTFIGDDHVFLTFARHETHPLGAFVADKHGGEYYRPVPFLLWWLLARVGAGLPWPFALLALALHAAAAWLVTRLLLAFDRPPSVARLSGALFFLSPAPREAAYWFAASTDLVATTATLAALVSLRRGRPFLSLAPAAVALLAKESAVVLPALALVTLRTHTSARPRTSWRLAARAVAAHTAVAALYLAIRWRVLGGARGGSGDPRAGWLARALQIVSGLVHIPTGHDLLPEWLAWSAGGSVIALALLVAIRRHRRASGDAAGGASTPLALIAIGVAPLLLVDGWFVGARYFYFPAVGVLWLVAELIAAAPHAHRASIASTAALVIVAALGLAQGELRRVDVAHYRQRVDAVNRAVLDGVRHGHRVFHVESGGLKDLDLAVKLAPALTPVEPELLVLSDAPASFVIVPPSLRARAAFLLADPPLPPRGAYVFGARRVQGLARREDAPDLADVVAALPAIRFIRLRAAGPGRVIWRDVTDEKLAALRGGD